MRPRCRARRGPSPWRGPTRAVDGRRAALRASLSSAAFASSGPFAKALDRDRLEPRRRRARADRVRGPGPARAGLVCRARGPASAARPGSARRRVRCARRGGGAGRLLQRGGAHAHRRRPAAGVPRDRPGRRVGLDAQRAPARRADARSASRWPSAAWSSCSTCGGGTEHRRWSASAGGCSQRRAWRPTSSSPPGRPGGCPRWPSPRFGMIGGAAILLGLGPAGVVPLVSIRRRRCSSAGLELPWWGAVARAGAASPRPRHTCSARSAPAASARPWRPSSGSPRCSSRSCSPGCCSVSCPARRSCSAGVLILGGVAAVRLGAARAAAEATRGRLPHIGFRRSPILP